MADPTQKTQLPPRRFSANLPLEVCFLAFIAVVVFVAFFEALTYKMVSARTPFVIMVPLIALILLHGFRLYRARGQVDTGVVLLAALRGRIGDLNKVLVLSGWFVGILVLIMVFGHYAGIFAFAFLLMWYAGDEKIGLAAAVAVGTTLFIYVVFELAFDIELYRGLILRWFQGYRDFG